MTLRISDEFTSPGNPAPSVERVSNEAFRSFIRATLSQLGREGDASDTSSPPDLRFVRVALAASGDSVPAAVRPPNIVAPAGGCSVRSPWIDIAMSADGADLSGTIYWNERQILRDRALLDGMPPPAGPASALTRSEFARLARIYGDNLMSGAALPADSIPSDVLWLFRKAPQSTRGPFEEGAQAAMQRIAAEATPSYANLIAALLDRCRQEPGKSFEYKTIKDVGSIAELEKGSLS